MIRRHVLAALTVGVAAGDDDAARAALGRIEWILRGQARRRLEHALMDATLATGVLDEGADATRHRLRAAAVIVDGHGDCDFADPAGITAAYAEIAAHAPVRWPIVTIAAAIACVGVALGGAVAAVELATASDANEVYTRPVPPPPQGAFRTGGAPLVDPAIEHVLAVELPALLAHRVADAVGRHAAAISLRDQRAFATHGRALAIAWREMIEGLDHWMDLESGHGGFRVASGELRARIEVVSDQLAAAQLGYYLAPDILAEHDRRSAGIDAYRIEEVAFVRTNDERVRVLGVRRLEPHATPVALLGMTTDELHDSVVVLDQIEAKVQAQILPVLAGTAYPLGEDTWGRLRSRAIGTAAGDAIRRELQRALGPDASSTERAAARCRALLTASVRHHEAQHGFDRQHGLPLPRALADHVGDASSALAVRSRYELSAYLAQIASDMWLPQLTLWNLSRHAFRAANSPIAEAAVAVVAIEGIARQLHLEPAGPVFHNGGIDRDRLAALVGPISAASTTELRAAAAKLWAELFEQPLVRIVDE